MNDIFDDMVTGLENLMSIDIPLIVAAVIAIFLLITAFYLVTGILTRDYHSQSSDSDYSEDEK